MSLLIITQFWLASFSHIQTHSAIFTTYITNHHRPQWKILDVSILQFLNGIFQMFRDNSAMRKHLHTHGPRYKEQWGKNGYSTIEKELSTDFSSLIFHIISPHYTGYMFAPNVERLLWRAVNWNATNLFTRGRNRSSAPSRAAERDSRSTSTWGHMCAFILEIAPTSAPSRYLTSSKVIIRWILLFRRVATRSLRNRQTWSHTSWRTRNKSLVGARSRRQIPFLEVIQTLTHTGDHMNNSGP